MAEGAVGSRGAPYGGSAPRTRCDGTTRKAFYDEYHRRRDTPFHGTPSRHHDRLARRIGIGPGCAVLDVGCGTGGWLAATRQRGAATTGVDLSLVAAGAAASHGAASRLCLGLAETLPFEPRAFDFVTCLGVLEHLDDPAAAILEMARVARPDGMLLFLVPNARFVARTLGLYHGTDQASLREEPRTAAGWMSLFRLAGLVPLEHWPDRHVVSWRWVVRSRPTRRLPLRLLAATMVPLLPRSVTYQWYFLCRNPAEPQESAGGAGG